MSALLWECVRHNHAYLKKGHGPKALSAEEGNMTGIHNCKFSGFSGRRVAGLSVITRGKKQTITLNTATPSDKAACPKKMFNKTGVSKNAKKATACFTRKLALYRPDLVAAASARYEKIKISLRK